MSLAEFEWSPTQFESSQTQFESNLTQFVSNLTQLESNRLNSNRIDSRAAVIRPAVIFDRFYPPGQRRLGAVSTVDVLPAEFYVRTCGDVLRSPR